MSGFMEYIPLLACILHYKCKKNGNLQSKKNLIESVTFFDFTTFMEYIAFVESLQF